MKERGKRSNNPQCCLWNDYTDGWPAVCHVVGYGRNTRKYSFKHVGEMGARLASDCHRDHSSTCQGVAIMALSIQKLLLIIVAVVNLVLIAVFTILGKTKIALALSVLEAFIVASTAMVE